MAQPVKLARQHQNGANKMPRPIMTKRVRQRALNATRLAPEMPGGKQTELASDLSFKGGCAFVRHDSDRPEYTAGGLKQYWDAPKARTLQTEEGDRDLKSNTRLTSRSALKAKQHARFRLQPSNTSPVPLPQARLSPSIGLPIPHGTKAYSRSVAVPKELRIAINEGPKPDSSHLSHNPRTPSYDEQPIPPNKAPGPREWHADTLSPIDQSMHPSDIGRKNDKQALLDPAKMHLLASSEIYILMAKYGYLAARKQARGNGSGAKALRLKIARTQCTLELCKRELRGLHAELGAREEYGSMEAADAGVHVEFGNEMR